MKLCPCIITAGAIVALAIPAAAGAASTRADTSFRVSKETVSFHEGRAVHKGRAAKSSKHASTKKHSVNPVTYIYVPAPAGTGSFAADPNECQNSGSNCTDEQACEFWGMNCSTAVAADQSTIASAPAQAFDTSAGAVQTMPEAQVISDTQVTSSSPTTGNFDLSNCVDPTDYALTNDPSYC